MKLNQALMENQDRQKVMLNNSLLINRTKKSISLYMLKVNSMSKNQLDLRLNQLIVKIKRGLYLPK